MPGYHRLAALLISTVLWGCSHTLSPSAGLEEIWRAEQALIDNVCALHAQGWSDDEEAAWQGLADPSGHLDGDGFLGIVALSYEHDRELMHDKIVQIAELQQRRGRACQIPTPSQSISARYCGRLSFQPDQHCPR